MRDKYIIKIARAISLLFTPFYFPVIAFLALFMFSYMNLLPLTLKITVLVIVYLFTVALPLLSIYLYRLDHAPGKPPHAPLRSLPAEHYELRLLLLRNGAYAHAPFHDGNHRGRAVHTGAVLDYQHTLQD